MARKVSNDENASGYHQEINPAVHESLTCVPLSNPVTAPKNLRTLLSPIAPEPSGKHQLTDT